VSRRKPQLASQITLCVVIRAQCRSVGRHAFERGFVVVVEGRTHAIRGILLS
jgi:hypothetical protein